MSKKNIIASTIIDLSIPAITTFAGILLIIWSINYSKATKEKQSYYILTDATVIDYDVSESDSVDHHSIGYGAIAEYEVNGEIYKIYPAFYVSSKSKLPQIGDIVQIRYDPNSPENAIWEKGDATSSVVALFGILSIIIGTFFLLTSKPKNKILDNNYVGLLVTLISGIIFFIIMKIY